MDLYADLQEVARAERSARYQELMRMTGLSPFMNRLAGKLSGGMKQKLGLACALLVGKGCLVLDVSDPEAPTPHGWLELPDVQGMAMSDEHVVLTGGSGRWFLDVAMGLRFRF